MDYLIIMTQMGGDIKLQGLGSSVQESVKSWFDDAMRKTTMKNDAGGDDADPVDVTHAPNERFGSSRSMLTATPSSPGLDEIVTVDDDRQPRREEKGQTRAG
jgi:hypothetical protein